MTTLDKDKELDELDQIIWHVKDKLAQLKGGEG